MSGTLANHPLRGASCDYINIINPDEGRRYKLNVKGEVHRLTVGKVKQCLASASSCPIPLPAMVLKLNGIPLANDRDLCGSFGITSGATLTVEDAANVAGAVDPRRARQVAISGDHPTASDRMSSFLSPRRRQLEIDTLLAQQAALERGDLLGNNALRGTIANVDDELDDTDAQRRTLERERRRADRALEELRQREAAANKEKERLAQLQAEEAARAVQREADLAQRREQLRAEQAAIRAVAEQKLANEKQRALLAQQRADFEADQQRLLFEQSSFDAQAKANELSLRAREIEAEQQRLAYVRQQRELELERRVVLRQKLRYYQQLGVEPPAALLRELEGDPAGQAAAALPGPPRDSPAHLHALANASPAPGMTAPAAHHRGPQPQPADIVDSAHILSNDSIATGGGAITMADGGYYNAGENAEESLRRLGEDLRLPEPLQFDENNTCVISVDGEYTLLVTYDADTERLFLYSTLLTSIPSDQEDPRLRLRLYEFLLEGALLGREMCGGGVGASVRDDFILMSTSLYMPTSQPWALRATVPQFLRCLQHWRAKVADFLGMYPTPVGSRDGSVPEAVMPPPPPPFAQHDGAPAERRTPAAAAAPAPAVPASGHRPPHAPPESPLLGLEVTGSVVLNGVASAYANGVLVVNVAGPAAAAGVMPCDFLRRLNGVPIQGVSQFQSEVRRLVPGSVATLSIERDGLPVTLSVHVGSAWAY